MSASQIHSSHAAWCRQMATEYRRDAKHALATMLPATGKAAADRWLKAADRLEEDAAWYEQHAEVMQ